jgi:hypothetical protein
MGAYPSACCPGRQGGPEIKPLLGSAPVFLIDSINFYFNGRSPWRRIAAPAESDSSWDDITMQMASSRYGLDALAQFLIDDPDRAVDFGIGNAELM